jgi:hypothetical protein
MLEFFPEFISNSSLLKISENYLKEEKKIKEKSLKLTHLSNPTRPNLLFTKVACKPPPHSPFHVRQPHQIRHEASSNLHASFLLHPRLPFSSLKQQQLQTKPYPSSSSSKTASRHFAPGDKTPSTCSSPPSFASSPWTSSPSPEQ